MHTHKNLYRMRNLLQKSFLHLIFVGGATHEIFNNENFPIYSMRLYLYRKKTYA